MAPNSHLSFWIRTGLAEEHEDVCSKQLEDVYLGSDVTAIENQGYCSFTFLVSPCQTNSKDRGRVDEGVAFLPDRIDGLAIEHETGEHSSHGRIVQIRPEQHSLDLAIAHAARETYGHFVPRIRALDVDFNLPVPLKAFEADLVRGTQYSLCQHRSRSLARNCLDRQVTLIKDFASFIARAWPPNRHCASHRNGVLETSCPGKVGCKITQKINGLVERLPSTALRKRAAAVSEQLPLLGDLPVVLNHGDLIPSNIMVDAKTGQLHGVVDWAEAEWLPFGMCLYGLEHLLGWLDTTESLDPTWQYYEEADFLRDLFWDELTQRCPDVSIWKRHVELSREVGILLWYGYAWDDGRIDRVVNAVDDAVEVECLTKFLGLI